MRWRLLAGIAVVLLVLFVGASLAFFVWPSTGSVPARADAVALLSGGRGDRLPAAERLMARGVAPLLVVPHGRDPRWPAGNRVCDSSHSYAVECPDPHPDTTRGEVELIGKLAAQRGWRRVVVVTSRYHVTRAGMLVRRCVHGTVSMVASTPHDSLTTWGSHVAHEWIGLGVAVVHRAC